MTRAARSALKIDVLVDSEPLEGRRKGQIGRAARRHTGRRRHPVNNGDGACYRPDR